MTPEKALKELIEVLYNKAKYETYLAFKVAKERNANKHVVSRRERAASVWRKWGE